QRSVELYRKVGEPVALGNAYMEMGGYYGVDDSISSERRKASFAAALEQFRLAGGPKDRMADALKNLGEVNYIARNYAEARMELREALAIYKTIGKKDIQDVYDLLGSVSSDLGDSPAAIQYGLMAIKTAEAAGDTSIQLCTIYHRLGFSYNTARQADLAIPIEEKALAIALKYKDENAVFTVLANLCGELIGAGQIEKALKILQETERKLPLHDKWSRTVLEAWHLNALTRLRRFDEAKEHAAALNTFLKDPNQSHYLQPLAIYTALIRYYIALGQPQVANKYIVEDLAEARKDHPLWSAQAWWLKSQVDSALGNFAASLSDYKLFKAINDSLFTVSRNYILAQTQIEYETDKKDKDLRLKQKDIDLLTSNNQLQVVQLKKAAFTRNGIVLGALVLLGLAYTAYKVKKSHNQKLRVQQVAINHQNTQLRQLLEEKDWLIREIHHRVKNNLQIVISLLNTQCEFLENPSALNAIRESKERMQAIAMLHQKLYMAEDSEAVVNMRSYIDEMVIHLQDSYEAAARSIFFRKQVADVDLDVSQAVPIALLLNEAITNSVKHACSPHKRGTIDIALTQPSAGHILLRIADDGPGLPA
ncbi:MAG TPA: histidine kinase dimerization/phosphoacceptor domain -containing protein, partial [Puia sp.]|nr:histidine kinase dimerization/phosphoacceptor domain -containing protein [Puia sp.]